ncbi:MAG TPA: hypothetical protein VFS58_15385 [Steroidobacteraceae bacterium]|nr:hypothetical protein [Steroidobacteraceae bacterium]
MKKFVFLLILGLGGVYALGRLQLGESGAMRFLTKMESLINEGDAAGACAMFHDDLEVEISDQSGDSPETMSGGKEELCELTRITVSGLRLMPHSMQLDYTDVAATQDWRHPWTSEIRYLENRSLSIPGANVTMRTVSEDQITLVHTFSGVKMRKLKSAIYKADAT